MIVNYGRVRCVHCRLQPFFLPFVVFFPFIEGHWIAWEKLTPGFVKDTVVGTDVYCPDVSGVILEHDAFYAAVFHLL